MWDSELIDTQWDVNDEEAFSKYEPTRINRYIVGCKLHTCIWLSIEKSELIDTQWDVN